MFPTRIHGFRFDKKYPMLITKTNAAASLSFVVNGVSLQAQLLQGTASGCDMAAHTARQWRADGFVVIEQRIGAWCVTGKVDKGVWLAEQWEPQLSSNKKSRGWFVRIPLNGSKSKADSLAYQPRSIWDLDVFDHGIQANIRYRQSFSGVPDHHKKSIAASSKNALVLTHPHPDGGSYSVVIQRDAKQ